MTADSVPTEPEEVIVKDIVASGRRRMEAVNKGI
eukprot:SAG11_NODE_28676_length_319_cov_0.690909_1_plen_33_part_10